MVVEELAQEHTNTQTHGSAFLESKMTEVRARSPKEPEFHQAVEEILESLELTIDRHPEFSKAKIIERIVEPERVIMFRVPWLDDKGEIQVNRGYRVQFNSAIGPYKGGLRFHPSVNLSILKFLGFEQIFKNALTGQPIGGGKGGSNFDPKGRSDNEVMRFCQSFMTELCRHIGPDTDVPAGDIGVGGREIGYMFGQYKRIRNEFTAVLTGRSLEWGGSLIRPEATGYGLVYFVAEQLNTRGEQIKGKTCVVSGSGNVAQYATEKIIELGGKVVTLSDSGGFIYDEAGIDREKLDFVMDLKNNRRGRIREYVDAYPKAVYTETDRALDHNPLWSVPSQCALPCATQNEINEKDVANMIENGTILIAEGANMPTNAGGQHLCIESGMLYGPAKAANAGGVAVSALEMAQGSQRMSWSRAEVDSKLKDIMKNIHNQCVDAAETYGCSGDTRHGANIAGYLKVAKAMLAQGVV